MSYKTIFIIFNIVIISSFLIIFLLPLFFLGQQYFVQFLGANWIAAALFITVIAIFNVYFLMNWSLFFWLEKEKWTELMSYLESQIYDKKRISGNYIKILINCYIVTSHIEKILELQAYLKKQRPNLALRFALQLGIPYVLHTMAEEAERYFKDLLDNKNLKKREWIEWNYAFALMQLKKKDDARTILLRLIAAGNEPVVRLLSLYLLNPLVQKNTEQEARYNTAKQDFKAQYPYHAWQKYFGRQKQNILVIILTKIIRQAAESLYKDTGPAVKSGPIVYN